MKPLYLPSPLDTLVMRFLIAFFIILSASFTTKAQNLVPNPSFEDTVYCPYGTNQMDACLHWKSYGNSPDYFNACTPFYGVPNQPFGYQFAHSGNAMTGIVLYRKPGQPGTPNAREFAGTQLLQPLQTGTKYYFSFFINFSYKIYIALACNKAGIRFSTVPFDSCCPPPISNWAHLYTDSIYTDSVQWLKVEGAFIADSAYNYISIGNFFDDSNTDTILLGTFWDNSYYYFDDICVTTDSIYNQTWTGLVQIEKEKISISPNPAVDFINVSIPSGNFNFEIYDHLGRWMNSGSLNAHNSTICIKELEPGLYFLRLRRQSIIISKPFLKQPQP